MNWDELNRRCGELYDALREAQNRMRELEVERDALLKRLEAAEGLAHHAGCVVATGLVNRVLKDTEFLALAGLDQALAAWRAGDGG